MKKILTILFLTSSSLLSAQQIPNGDFEKWSLGFGGLFLAPTGWYAGAASAESITKVDGMTVGTFAAKLQNIDFMQIDTAESALTGTFSVSSVPTKLTGYYKCNMKGLDSASATLILGSKQDALSQDDAAAVAYIQFGGVVNTFTYFEASVHILKNEKIDTGGVLLNSNALEGNLDLHEHIQPGSYIIFDQLSLSYSPTGLDNNFIDQEAKLYPNPAHDFVIIDNGRGADEYSIHDLSGNELATGPLHEGINKVVLDTFSAGSYLFRTKSEAGARVNKLIVK